ncbi:MAG TPA: hypothetical protein VII72_04125 [Myxococcota bacterium]|jgi:hypothetical protein
MRKPTRIALVALAALTGAALSLLTSDRWQPAAPDTEIASAPAPVAPEPSRIAPPVAAGELRIGSGETIELDAASLTPGTPLVLRLTLGEPSRTQDPRPVRVVSADSRVFEGEGVLGEGLADARFEIDPAFLSAPGRYIVEVKTTELSHFPLRRYAIQVR